MWKRFIEWIKSLLNKTEFDNDLFKKGVYRVKKELKEQLKSIEVISIETLFDHVVTAAYNEFGGIAIIRKQLDKAVAYVHDEIKENIPKWTSSVKTQIDFIGEKLIEYYNKHF